MDYIERGGCIIFTRVGNHTFLYGAVSFHFSSIYPSNSEHFCFAVFDSLLTGTLVVYTF